MAAPRAILLDMGETIAYQDPPGDQVLIRWLAEMGVSVKPSDVHRARLAATSYYYVLALARPSLGVNEAKGTLVDAFDGALLRCLDLEGRAGITVDGVQAAFRGLARHLRLYDDALRALSALKARGARLAIVSNWDVGLVDRCRELGLTDVLDAIVGSATVRTEKPNPAIFDLALSRLGVDARDAWYVGDLYAVDVLGARAAGLRPILLDRHGLLANLDCPRIRSLLELPSLYDEAASDGDYAHDCSPGRRTGALPAPG